MSAEAGAPQSQPEDVDKSAVRDQGAAQWFRLYWRDRWPNGPEEFDMEWAVFEEENVLTDVYTRETVEP